MKKNIVVTILIILFTGHVFAQQKVSGVVKNIAGEPIPGVSVAIKDSGRALQGVITNIDGKYTVSNVHSNSKLVFSFVGMMTEEVIVGTQTTIDVTMIDDYKTLEDVVIVGYGAVKRENLTGSVANISSEEIKDIPAGDLSSTLKGKLSGVTIDRATGKPGAVSTFQIRESSSYGPAAETPLFVIDGIVRDQDAFDILDPTEVESISVLKDAAASVYGVRAAGGVVVIKTKGGKKGKPKINYSGSYGIGQGTDIPKMLTAYEHAKMLNDINDLKKSVDHQSVAVSSYFSDDELESFKNTDYNWLNEMWKNAYQTRHTLNLSGGNEKLTYFASGAVYNETGNIHQVTLDRYSLRTNIEGEIVKGLKANFGLSYDQKATQQPNYASESQDGVLRDFYKQLLTAPRWVPMEVNGNPVYNDKYINWNPYGLVQSDNYKKSSSYNTSVNASLEYELPFIKGLSANIQYGQTQSSDRGKEFSQDYTGYNLVMSGDHKHIFNEQLDGTTALFPNEPKLYMSTTNSQSYQLNTSLSYTRKFGKHDIKAILIYEQSEGTGSGFTTTQLIQSLQGHDYPWAFNTSSLTLGSSDTETGILGYIGRLNYIYSEKYILEAAFREDASTNFAPNYRWGFFPSASAGWVLSSEDFFKEHFQAISFLKLRGSFGLLGNDKTPSFQWTQLYATGANGALFGSTMTNGISVRNSGILTPNLTWQRTRSYNLGMDLKLFNNKILFTTDYYYKYTYDIFDRRSNTHDNIPLTVGIGSDYPYENYGQMYAKGVEFELGYNGRINNDLSYTLNGKLAWNKAQRLRVFQSNQEKNTWRDYTRNDLSNQGGLISTGIIRTQAEVDAILAQNPNYTIGGVKPAVGMLNYKDLHGSSYYDAPDGKIDGYDIGIIAKVTSPPYVYSFSCGATWKGLKLDFLFNGEFGHKVFIQKDEQVVKQGNNYTDQVATDDENALSFWSDYWTPDNPNAKYPRPYKWGEDGQISTFWMRDGNTLRLTTATLSYNMPTKFSQKLGIPQFRIYVTATNLWTIISPYDYKDPSVSRAYDYPLIKSYNLGLNISL